MKRGILGLLVVWPALAGAKGTLLDKLPGKVQVVTGMTRDTSAETLLAELRKLPLPKEIPPCAIELFAKVEEAAVAFDGAGKDVTGGIAVRGEGLKAAADACIAKSGAKVVRDGKAWTIGSDIVVWLDDGTAVLSFGPGHARPEAEKYTVALNPRLAPPLAKLEGGGGFWIAVDVAALPDAQKAWPADLPRAGRVWASFGSDLTLRVTAETASAADAKALADKVQTALATKAPPQLAAAAAKAHVSSQAQNVVVEAPIGDLLGPQAGRPSSTVATMGILASVAIPAFMKNARKAKTAEAVTNLKKIYDGARAAYEEKHQFPPSAPLTPALGACCKSGGKCAPDPKLWTAAGWRALEFSMDDPHYYAYQYQSDGKGFTATAYGDLNCDGTYSTFELQGIVGADGKVTGSAGMFRDKELE